MELPDPAELESLRQAYTREQLVRRVGLLALTGVLYVNLFGGALGAIVYGYGPVGAGAISMLTAALPFVGIVLLNRWAQRHHRHAAEDVRAALGIRARDRGLATLAFFGLASVVPAIGWVLWGWEMSTLVAAAYIALGVLGPAFRRLRNPELPVWALVALGVWSVIGGGWVLALRPVFGDGGEMLAGVVWMALMPMGLPAWALRHRLVSWSRRDGRIGQVARAWGVFLPPAQAAQLTRESGDLDGALASLTRSLETPQPLRLFAETLLELGDTLLSRGDPRAPEVFGACGRAVPADPRPFAGLARALASSDRERALAYARFAEDNAARQLSGGDPAVTALRASLERQ
ncbi:MAG: hypothetical protein R3F61_24395 [Myxococcota bacterium]